MSASPSQVPPLLWESEYNIAWRLPKLLKAEHEYLEIDTLFCFYFIIIIFFQLSPILPFSDSQWSYTRNPTRSRIKKLYLLLLLLLLELISWHSFLFSHFALKKRFSFVRESFILSNFHSIQWDFPSYLSERARIEKMQNKPSARNEKFERWLFVWSGSAVKKHGAVSKQISTHRRKLKSEGDVIE